MIKIKNLINKKDKIILILFKKYKKDYENNN